MIVTTYSSGQERPHEIPALKSMFEARKQVFVDLLKWDVPVIDDRFEVDQFDDEAALYLIVSDPAGRHLASARLLPTVRPHILDSLFPGLCDLPIPAGHATLEITRFCLSRGFPSGARREARDTLVSALVAHALVNGIERYTGVAEIGWLSQILSFGWDCRQLGLPKLVEGKLLGAICINITPRTPSLLADNGIFREMPFEQLGFSKAA